MADSKREAALKALFAALQGIAGPVVLRNEPEAQDIPDAGLIVLRDGDPGEPDVLLSPAVYEYSHQAEVVVQVEHRTASVRDATLDALLQAIDARVEADPTLGGTVEDAVTGAPELLDVPEAGAETIKAALVRVTLIYVSPTPLG